MKLETFKEKEKKKYTIYVFLGVIILFISAIFLYRTYSIYQESQEFDVIKGNVPDQNYDAMFSFYLIDENGNKTISNTMPEGKDYRVSITCNNGANGSWDRETWGPRITNLTTTRTKCYINFVKANFPLREYGIEEPVIKEGNGLYEVTHSDASITYTNDETAINNLKMTEYRYAGANPNNYVTFNEEEAGWRIIGLVNTPEGQRIKLIRDESIGNYSWDSSASSVNGGAGVNEWSQADLMNLLNSGAYYNRTSGTCYNDWHNATTSCNFTNTGFLSQSKAMIDTVTWNTGTTGQDSYAFNTLAYYNVERSNKNGKICTSGTYCNDTILRTYFTKKQIGLMYPSDYGYATSGGEENNRSSCLNSNLNEWDGIKDCYQNNYLHLGYDLWTITPCSSSAYNQQVLLIASAGRIGKISAVGSRGVLPSIYLKSEFVIINGEGTKENPYQLKK